MSAWGKVGSFLRDNADSGLALVGSLLTGNVPAAVAAGASLVSGATGRDNPMEALEVLQQSPEARVALAKIAKERKDRLLAHKEAMLAKELEAEMAIHAQGQETVRAGDAAEDSFVRRTRPGHAWVSLFGALAYVFVSDAPSLEVLLALLALPMWYAGMREIGKFTASRVDIARLKGA